MSMKNPPTPAGIEPATFRIVAQHLNHFATGGPQCVSVVRLIVATRSSGPLPSQPACFLPDAPLCWSLFPLPDYSLWGYLKGRVYQNKSRTTDALKANITEEIQAVTADVLARTFQNMARRVQSCLDANGGHFQHMLRCRHISYTMR